MSESSEWWDGLLRDLRTRGRWLVCMMIDSGFLAVWILVQFACAQIEHTFSLAGVDQFNLSIFRILFSLATLSPIILNLYGDIMVELHQTIERINNNKSAKK